MHVREMGDDFWEYDPKRYALVGRNSGRRLRAGNPVKVKITGADTHTRQIDLAFAEEPGAVPEGEKKGKKAQSRAAQLSRSRKKSSNKKKRRR